MNPKFSPEYDCSRNQKKTAIFRLPTLTARPLLRLNTLLDQAILPYDVNEEQIENWLNTLEVSGDNADPIYWLLWIRLMEAALLCAGNYVDNCEFSAAGDLLVNPREILLHSQDARPPARKRRHGRLSDQFRENGHSPGHAIETLKNEYHIEITRPPLFQVLFRGLKGSGRIASAYLEHVDRQMWQITDTIGFLTSWQIFDAADLHTRIRVATPETRLFISSHLCRFDNRIFLQAGNAVQRMAIDPSCPCDLLST